MPSCSRSRQARLVDEGLGEDDSCREGSTGVIQGLCLGIGDGHEMQVQSPDLGCTMVFSDWMMLKGVSLGL
jgi:hypothetical protein